MQHKSKNNQINRRTLLKYGLYSGCMTGLAPSLFLGGCSNNSNQKKPNVVLIVLDTARADRFSCMGYTRKTSPNIDALMSQGVIFDRTYSTCCWTLPAHASLFSALYPTQAGATSETLQFPAANETLAEILTQNGYDTIGIACNPWVAKERGFDQGFTEFYEMWRAANRSTPPHPTLEHDAVQRANTWLDQKKPGSKPFFMFMNLNGTHLPYRPEEPYLSNMITPGYNNAEVNRVASITSIWDYLAGAINLTERDFGILNDLYDGEVALADYYVAQITEKLQSLGILDDTLIIITSDHGENLGEHGLIDHMICMYDTTIHIPLFIRYPEKFAGGIKIDNLVSIVDIAPTILNVCNIDQEINKVIPSEISLANSQRPQRAYVVATNEKPLTGIALMQDRHSNFDIKTIDYRMRSLRTKEYKLITKSNEDVEMFNLLKDPSEIFNLAETQKDLNNKLQSILQKWIAQIPDAGDISFLESQDSESLEMLRSLGYIK